MTLVPVDTTSALAVTDYLTKARDWLSTAVETSTPIGIAGAKVEIAVAAEATKQLGLSKEIQDEAAEMVRRAEYTLRKAATKAQETGEVRTRGDNLIPGGPAGTPPTRSSSDLPSARDFFNGKQEYEDANAMGALDAPAFEEVIEDAKAEGNLSRANVARKAREKAGNQKARPRPAAEVNLNLISSYADRAAREAQKLTADQIRRVKPNAAEWVGGIRNSIEVLSDLLRSLEEN